MAPEAAVLVRFATEAVAVRFEFAVAVRLYAAVPVRFTADAVAVSLAAVPVRFAAATVAVRFEFAVDVRLAADAVAVNRLPQFVVELPVLRGVGLPVTKSALLSLVS